MVRTLTSIAKGGSALALGASALLVGTIGLLDYLTGCEIVFSIFYCFPVLYATWYAGRPAGFLIAVLSVAAWLTADTVGGVVYCSAFVLWWNASAVLLSYGVLVLLSGRLHALQQELEARVCSRTDALVDEMAKREQLEKEMLSIGENEQRRIGRDLHDTLGQHLTGTALAAQVLQERLSSRSLPEAQDAGRVVELIELGIGMTRDLARGLSPVGIEADGLMAALHDLAVRTNRGQGTVCRCECEESVLLHNDATATHLYRIAQEAVANACRHGHAREIWIRLALEGDHAALTVEDDGVGLPAETTPSNGMGLRIMAQRARMIGATLRVLGRPGQGTTVTCTVGVPQDEATPPGSAGGTRGSTHATSRLSGG